MTTRSGGSTWSAFTPLPCGYLLYRRASAKRRPPLSARPGIPSTTQVLAAGRQVLVDDPHRLDGVPVLSIDEYC